MFNLKNVWKFVCARIAGNLVTLPIRRLPKQLWEALNVERLEERALLTAAPVFPVEVRTLQVDTQTVAAGTQDLVFAELAFIGKRGVNPKQLQFDAAAGTSLDDVENWTLQIDTNRDGVFETEIEGNVNNKGLQFGFRKLGPLVVASRMPMRIVGDVPDDLVDGTRVGLDDVFVKFAARPRTAATYTGPDNPVHVVDAPARADLSVVLSSQTHVEAGTSLRYNVYVSNNGAEAAENVTVVVEQSDGHLDTLHLGTLAPGATRLMEVTFGTPNVGAYVTATATVTSDAVDPVATNNVSIRQTNLTHTNVVTITFDGNDGFVRPDQDNVSFGTMSIDTTKGSVVAEKLFFSLYATDSVNENLGLEMHDFIEDVQFRNVVTGLVVHTTEVFSDSSVGVYQVPNIVLEDGSQWQLLADFEEEYPGFLWSGDVFQASLILGPDLISVPGVGATWQYNPVVTDADLNAVVEILPGGILSGPYQAISISALDVGMVSNGTTDTVVSNEKNFGLASFYVAPNQDGEVLFTGVAFEAAQGSVLNLNRATLWVDTDGNNVTDLKIADALPQNGMLTFDMIVGGGFIPVGQTRFEVRGDAATSLTSDTLQLALVAGSVTAEEVDTGADLSSGQITVDTSTASKVVTFVSSGDLAVILDRPSRPEQMLGGVLGEEALRVQLRAQYEPIDVFSWHFLVTGDGASNVERLELYRLGSTVAFASATVGATGSDIVPAGGLTFTAKMHNQQLVIANDYDETVIIRPRMKSDENGAVSGRQFQVAIHPGTVVNNVTGEGAIHARGLFSSRSLSGNDGDAIPEGEIIIGADTHAPNVAITGPVETTVLSKIAGIWNASSQADGTNIFTGIGAVGEWYVSAAVNNNSLNGLNKAVPDTLIFDVDSMNVLSSQEYYLYNKADASNKVLATSVVTTATGVRVTFTGLSTSAVDTRISSGSGITLVLQDTIINSKVSNASTSTLIATMHTDDSLWYDTDTMRTSITGFGLGDSRIKSVALAS